MIRLSVIDYDWRGNYFGVITPQIIAGVWNIGIPMMAMYWFITYHWAFIFLIFLNLVRFDPSSSKVVVVYPKTSCPKEDSQ